MWYIRYREDCYHTYDKIRSQRQEEEERPMSYVASF
jgi:hypothetical protein